MLDRIEWTVQHIEPGYFPMLADNATGEWKTHRNPKWTGGFWVGMLWMAYEKTGQEKYLEWARAWNDSILGYEHEGNHDRGFVYFYSSVYAYKLTKNPSYLNSALQAARQLVEMFQSSGGIIPQNLKDKENVIIDTMMNLQLLWWTHFNANENDPLKNSCPEIALLHAQTTLTDFIREDGSTWQSVHYDSSTGKIIKKHTHQGYSDSSCWSRGQSWGFYGFLKAYEATGNDVFLDAAKALGEYIIVHLPDDGVPWYDYDDPGKYKDTSAGAIAASAFLQLSKTVTDPNARIIYYEFGKQMVANLIKGHLTPFIEPESLVGILRNGCYQIYKNADSETIWGDYYLMEALAALIFERE
ncbi:MAG: glycoside hydrolase family 88 protein [Gemmatimonadota bacterium]|nr:MAG: glycoside hydrolase family 88 protein [Gemmatimonadota bacterium]